MTKNYFKIISVVICISVIFAFTEGDKKVIYNKESAIEKITEIKDKVGCNTKVYAKLIKYTKKATKNFDSFVYLAELDAKFKFSSENNLSLAKVIVSCKKERAIFKDIAELIYLNVEENLDVTSIAKKVITAKTNEDIAILENKISFLKSTAQYKSIDDVPVK